MSTTLSACRWNWCTSTFSDHASLRVHVETEHIATAEPVKRKDITLLQRTEDGTSLQGSSSLLYTFHYLSEVRFTCRVSLQNHYSPSGLQIRIRNHKPFLPCDT
ncbi:hypothetical protein K439DRAFT_1334144 [Ramaria rubella]|nr:hypothetical protein K439DRAFT_1334144 [Ramaria rubella]